MKVKNVMFAGFAAAILMGTCGAARANDNMILTSKAYVDNQNAAQNTVIANKANAADVYTKDEVYNKTQVDNTVSGLNTKIEAMNGDTGSVATAIAGALTEAKGYTDQHATTAAQTYATKDALSQGLATKQDTITDLATIRSGAAAGATAVQTDTFTAFQTQNTAAIEAAQAAAEEYADGLAGNYATAAQGALADTAVQTDTFTAFQTQNTAAIEAAQAAAEDYADGLAVNYDSVGSAAQALVDAKAYADQAEADAVATAKGYTDTEVAGAEAATAAVAADLADLRTDLSQYSVVDGEGNTVTLQSAYVAPAVTE